MHLLFGPDGNRRFAHQARISYAEAYAVLAKKLLEIVAWSIADGGVKTLTVWLLQEYNLRRAENETRELTRLCETFLFDLLRSPLTTNTRLRVRLVGELASFFENSSIPRNVLEDAVDRTSGHDGMLVNVVLAYNADKELGRALYICAREEAEPTFSNLAQRWSIAPVDLFIRTGQPDGFVNLSSYWPLIERGRMVSTPVYPQEFTKEQYVLLLSRFRDLKDSINKMLGHHFPRPAIHVKPHAQENEKSVVQGP